jgi:hypothetical protein
MGCSCCSWELHGLLWWCWQGEEIMHQGSCRKAVGGNSNCQRSYSLCNCSAAASCLQQPLTMLAAVPDQLQSQGASCCFMLGQQLQHGQAVNRPD